MVMLSIHRGSKVAPVFLSKKYSGVFKERCVFLTKCGETTFKNAKWCGAPTTRLTLIICSGKKCILKNLSARHDLL